MSDLTPTSGPTGFTLPADYYASPVTARPLFPSWVPIGCGLASAILLAIAFVGGALVMSMGVGKMMAYVIDSSHGELKAMYGKDVSPAKRAQVDAALDGISHDLAADKLAYAKLEPLLTAMRDTMDDKKITNAEADQLLAKVQEVRKPKVLHGGTPLTRRSAPPSPAGRGR
ncbi:MAG TPA: hypothetical protein VGJ81_20625 [Thermoanaerobaculia bacterium]